jgi:hypothetical protein
MKNYRSLQFLCVFCMFSLQAQSQPGINSIYSSYGIGDVNIRDMNSYTSMGGVGIAIASDKGINGANPASFAFIPYGTYGMDLSFTGKNITYKNESQSFKANDFVINGAAFSFSLSKKAGASVSLKRYSTAEYYILANRYLEGTNSKLSETITGSGGLYLASAGFGLKLGKALSIGFSGGSIFGSINSQEKIYTSATEGYNIENNIFYNNFFANGGMQYRFTKAGIKWTLGATVQPSIKLNKTADYYIKELTDTILYQEVGKTGKFEYPLQWGAGISAQIDDNMLSLDFIKQNWSSTGYKGTSFKTTDLQNIALGYKHTYKRYLWNRKTDGITFMAGLQKENSYLIINNYQVKSYAATAGFTFPSKNGRYNYTAGLKYGQRGTVAYPLVRENFAEINFSLSLGNFLNVGGVKYY